MVIDPAGYFVSIGVGLLPPLGIAPIFNLCLFFLWGVIWIYEAQSLPAIFIYRYLTICWWVLH